MLIFYEHKEKEWVSGSKIGYFLLIPYSAIKKTGRSQATLF